MNTVDDTLDNIKLSFETINQFRMLAPESVAQGMLALCEDEQDASKLNEVAAFMMDKIVEHVPTTVRVMSGGKTITSPAYPARYSESMIRDIQARYKELSVSKAHTKRMKAAKEFLLNFTPTISLKEALFRLSFYLIPNENNLAKSTNNLISFTKRIFEDTQNNMLVDSAILIGGQGKSTVQTGLKLAAEKIGLSTNDCNLPSIRDGVQESFVRNEICVDADSKFERVDYESLNKILDKQQVVIKGKYIKEWQARSVANVLVGTNFLPTDVNARRYAIRMVDENFKLEENFGKWTIPGYYGDVSASYPLVIEWTTEAWLNLFYYCNKYRIEPLSFKEKSFDYSLLYRIQKALLHEGNNVCTILDMVRFFERDEGYIFDWKTKQNYRNKLYMLTNQLKLEIIGEKKKNMYSTYDWSEALDIDDKSPSDPLEYIHCFFYNNPNFDIDDSIKIEIREGEGFAIYQHLKDWQDRIENYKEITEEIDDDIESTENQNERSPIVET